MIKDEETDSKRTTSAVGATGYPSESREYMYLIPYDTKTAPEFSFLDLCIILWGRKYLILIASAVGMIAAVIYTIMSPEWYRAETVLIPVEEVSAGGLQSRSSMIGSLAGIAGISIGGGGSVEPMAVFRSRDFTRQFIEDNHLMTVFLHDHWDSEKNQWKESDPEDRPDIRDAIRYFDENVRSVTEDPETGLVTLAIDWTDPEAAADWANSLVVRINRIMKERALGEATKNVKYLQEQLGKTNVATLKESIGSLLEAELQKMMLAQGNDEFSFRVIDRAGVPDRHFRPNLVLITTICIILGAVLAIFIVLLEFSISKSRRRKAALDAS